jgi:hypothetical protein
MMALTATPRMLQVQIPRPRRAQAVRAAAPAAPRPSFWQVLLRALAAAAV